MRLATEEIMEAIMTAPRCPAFYGDDLDPEPCDGLEGCQECLRLAAEAVLFAGCQ